MKTLLRTIILCMTFMSVTKLNAQNTNIGRSKYIFAYFKTGDTSNISRLLSNKIYYPHFAAKMKGKPKKDINYQYKIKVWQPIQSALKQQALNGKELGIDWAHTTIKSNRTDTSYSEQDIDLKQTIYFESAGKYYIMKVEYRKLHSAYAFVFREIALIASDEVTNKKMELFSEYGDDYMKACSVRLARELQHKPTPKEIESFQNRCSCSLNKLSTDDDEKNLRKSASPDTAYFYFYDCEKNTYNTMKSE